jgi:hypothetical protein
MVATTQGGRVYRSGEANPGETPASDSDPGQPAVSESQKQAVPTTQGGRVYRSGEADPQETPASDTGQGQPAVGRAGKELVATKRVGRVYRSGEADPQETPASDPPETPASDARETSASDPQETSASDTGSGQPAVDRSEGEVVASPQVGRVYRSGTAGRLAPTAATSWLRPLVAVIVAGTAALVLWSTSLPLIDTDNIGDAGLVTVLPPSFFLALALVTVAFVISVRSGLRARWRAALVGILVLILHGTAPLIYDAPRFAYVYKHLGVVDLVTRYGSADRTIDAYNNWPGFFLLNAYFREAGGLRTSLDYTAWAPVFFNLCFALVLFLAYRCLIDDTDVRWVGIWLFLLGNWVGQDYLAPQAFAFLMTMAVLAIGLAWLRKSPGRWGRWIPGRWLDRLSALRAAVPRGTAPPWWKPLPPPPLPIGGRWMAVLLTVILFGAVVASHQLTPLMAIAAVSVLVVVARLRPWWLPVVMAAMTVLWFAVVAGEFLSAHAYLIGDVGQRPDTAVSSNLSDLDTAPGQVLVAWTSRVLSAALWSLAAVGVVTRWRRGHRDWALIALAASPLPMVAALSYGGEMLFRIYFFALPWVALLAGAAVAELCRSKLAGGLPGRRAPVLVTLLCFTLTLGWCIAAYGQDKGNHIRSGEVQASAWFYEHAPDGSLMMLVNGNFPSRLEGNYGRFEVNNFFLEPRYHNHDFTTADLPRLIRILEGDTRASMAVRRVKEADAYVIISTSQVEYADLYRLASPEQIGSLETLLATSNQFELVYSNPDARVYQLLATISP